MKENKGSVDSYEEAVLSDWNALAVTRTTTHKTGTFELKSLHSSYTERDRCLSKLFQKLRRVNNVSMLEFRDLDLSQSIAALKDYVRSNERLQCMELNTSSMGGTEGIGAFFSSLYRNTSLQSLRLFGVNQLENCASELRDLLRRNRSLQLLSFSCNDLNASARCIAQGLQRNTVLREINFDSCNLDDASFREILAAISSTRCVIQELYTNDNPLTTASLLQALQATQQEHASLQALYFGYSDRVYTEDKDVWNTVVRFVADEDRSTTTLRDFSLENCDIPEESTRELIQALETNTFLKFFSIDAETESTWLQLLETLPKIQSLRELVISNYVKRSKLNNSFAELLADAICRNQSLHRFEVLMSGECEEGEEDFLSEDTERKIDFYMIRNRVAPLIVAPKRRVPRSLWPCIAERLLKEPSGHSVVYSALRQKIDLLPQGVSRKRRYRNEALVVDDFTAERSRKRSVWL